MPTVIALFLLIPAFVYSSPVDLKTAVDQALAQSISVKRLEESLNETRFAKYVAWTTLLPLVDLQAGSTYRKDSVANKTVGSVNFGGEPYNLYEVNLRGEQPILAYGLFSATSRSRVEHEIRETLLEKQKRDITRHVIEVFYRVIMSEQLVRIYDDQQRVVKEILGIAQRRLNLGGKRTDVLQVRTKLASLQPKKEKAQSDLAKATATLVYYMGKQGETSIELKGDIPAVSLPAVEKKLNWQPTELPEMAELRLKRESIDVDKTKNLGSHLPNLKLVGNFNYINYTKAELFDPASNSWSVQLLLSVPLFSGFSSIFERRGLNSRYYQVELEETLLHQNLQLQQIGSRKTLEAANASLASAEEATKLAKDSLREARREYGLGIIDFLQFLQVQDAEFEAQTTLMQLRYDATLAMADYFVASGQPLPVLVDHLQAVGK